MFGLIDTRFEPSELEKCNFDNVNCSQCNNILIKEYKLGKYQIGKDCGYCRYSDRPYTIGSSSLYSHYPNGCECEYGEKEFLYIICKNCINPKCSICNIKSCYKYGGICDECNIKEQKKYFMING
jgi:hypothetical protein